MTLLGLITELLVEGDDSLGNGLTDGNDLGAGTTTSDANSDVEVLEASLAEEEKWLHNLHSHGDGLDDVE